MLQKVAATITALAMSGCAMTPERFHAEREKLTDGQVCDTVSVAIERGDPTFSEALAAEIQRRGLSRERCEEIAADERRAAAIFLAVLAVGAAAAAGSGGGGNSYAGTRDYNWAWDQFANQNGVLVWACRGIQTGQFAEEYHCMGKFKADTVWPGPYLR